MAGTVYFFYFSIQAMLNNNESSLNPISATGLALLVIENGWFLLFGHSRQSLCVTISLRSVDELRDGSRVAPLTRLSVECSISFVLFIIIISRFISFDMVEFSILPMSKG